MLPSCAKQCRDIDVDTFLYIAAGSGNMNVLYSVYSETSLVCSRNVTRANTAIDSSISLYTLYNT